MMLALLLAHATATAGMFGLIWFVQIVHYPIMDRIPPADFARFEAVHVRLTGLIVAPLMFVEAVSAVALSVLAPGVLTWVGAALLAVVWGSTFAVQVPAHRALERGFDAAVHRRLVRTNWIRTIAWSGRLAVALWLLVELT